MLFNQPSGCKENGTARFLKVPPTFLIKVAVFLGVAVFCGFPVAVLPLEVSAFQEDAVSSLKGHSVNQPIDISADRSELNDKDQTVFLSGNVLVTQGDLVLKTEELTLYYRRQESDNPEIVRIDALTDVSIVRGTETIKGKWGVYDTTKRLITFGGGVTLVRNETEVKGELLQVDLVSGITTLESTAVSGEERGRVRGRFQAPPLDKKDQGSQ